MTLDANNEQLSEEWRLHDNFMMTAYDYLKTAKWLLVPVVTIGKHCILNFIYSEKATKFCEISSLLLPACTVDKSKGEILQNFGAFSEYMNFKSWNKIVNDDDKNYVLMHKWDCH